MSRPVTCRCADIAELWDDDAYRYAEDHLRRIEVRADGWETVYRCPDTSREWLLDHPRGEEHGGGPARLRQTRDIRER